MASTEKKVLALYGGALAVDDRMKYISAELDEAKSKNERKYLERRKRALGYQLKNLGTEWIKAFGDKK
jgi:hypothetical protein